MGDIWRFCRLIWASLFSIAGWVGIVFLAKDAQEMGAAVSVWQEIVLRDTALLIFSGVLVLWILYSDISPFIYRWVGYQPPVTDRSWMPTRSSRLIRLRRLIFSITIETNRVLMINARPNIDFVDFSVFAVRIHGRNNRNKEVDISGYLQVEGKRARIPLFIHVNGDNRTDNGTASVRPFESFTAHASLTEPESGKLVCNNKISDAMFLRDYAPFSLVLSINGNENNFRFSYSRVRAEIDHERDRVLFYEQNKAD